MASGKQPLIGVNLGGWLVLERWMTPSLFAGTDAVDEYTFCLGADAARLKKLKQFRDTFITRDDIAWLAAQGVQTLRLPVGYWLFGQQGSFVKTCQYVDMFFEWAAEFEMKILVSLHGAPGSQNGQDHSGQKGEINWHLRPENITLTTRVLERIAERYGDKPALLGISLLNETSPRIPLRVLQGFYERAVAVMKPHCHAETWFVISDSFRPGRWRRRLGDMQLDHHHYQLYSWLDKLLPIWVQQLRIRYTFPLAFRRYARGHRLVIGEWSLALRQDKLHRHDGEQRADAYKRYGHAQLRAFSGADAWFYWSYKVEGGGPWSFRDCVEKGLLKID